MLKIIIRWVLLGLFLLLMPSFVRGLQVNSLYAALITVVALGIVNAVIKPILLILTLPINILTLGLFTFIINGVTFWFVSTFISGFNVAGFWTAVWGALIYSAFSFFLNYIDKTEYNFRKK